MPITNVSIKSNRSFVILFMGGKFVSKGLESRPFVLVGLMIVFQVSFLDDVDYKICKFPYLFSALINRVGRVGWEIFDFVMF